MVLEQHGAVPLGREPVQPVGQRYGGTIVGGPEVNLPVFPEDTQRVGSEVRALRKSLGRGLRDAARLAGLSATELSAIEIGAVRLQAPKLALAHLRLVWSHHEE
jgi:hypothetical protein